MTYNWKVNRAEAERLHPLYDEIAAAERADQLAREDEQKRILAVGRVVAGGPIHMVTEDVAGMRLRLDTITESLAEDPHDMDEAVELLNEMADLWIALDNYLPY